MIKKCTVCDAPFESSSPQKTCSAECKAAHKRQYAIAWKAAGGGEGYVRPKRERKRRYCVICLKEINHRGTGAKTCPGICRKEASNERARKWASKKRQADPAFVASELERNRAAERLRRTDPEYARKRSKRAQELLRKRRAENPAYDAKVRAYNRERAKHRANINPSVRIRQAAAMRKKRECKTHNEAERLTKRAGRANPIAVVIALAADVQETVARFIKENAK